MVISLGKYFIHILINIPQYNIQLINYLCYLVRLFFSILYICSSYEKYSKSSNLSQIILYYIRIIGYNNSISRIDMNNNSICKLRCKESCIKP